MTPSAVASCSTLPNRRFPRGSAWTSTAGEVIRLLMERQADPNVADLHGVTPLHRGSALHETNGWSTWETHGRHKGDTWLSKQKDK